MSNPISVDKRVRPLRGDNGVERVLIKLKTDRNGVLRIAANNRASPHRIETVINHSKETGGCFRELTHAISVSGHPQHL